MNPRLPSWLRFVDWALLRQPLALLALSGLSSAALTGTAALANLRLEHQVRAGHAALATAAERGQRARDSAALVAAHAATVDKLRDLGFLGEERRLTWIEALRAWQAERHIENLRYQFEPRKPWQEPGAEPSTTAPSTEESGHGGTLFATRSQISARLLHEGDWLALFSTLDAQARGFYTVEQCQLRRDAAGATAVAAGGLEMTCRLRWHTLGIEPEPEP